MYLAGHKDIFNGEIVGYALGARMTKGLVMHSLYKAVAQKRPPAGFDPPLGPGQPVLLPQVPETADPIQDGILNEPEG